MTGIYIAIIAIGLALGLFVDFELSHRPLPWQVAAAAFPASLVVLVLWLGFFVAVIGSTSTKYLFWFIYSCSLFAAAIGLGAIAQTAYLSSVEPGAVFILGGAIGYLCGLPIVAKIYKWRHGVAP